MAEWARVDDVDPEWRRRWAESERRFFARDTYGLLGSGICAPTPGSFHPCEALGRAEVGEREIRIVDVEGSVVLDVRRGVSARWPRTVVHHETEEIGTIRRRPLSWLARPCWTLVDAEGDLVATVVETSMARTAGRRVGAFLWAVLVAIVTLGNHTPESRPPTDFGIFAGRGQVGRIAAGSLLDLSTDQQRIVDRRLAVAAFVALLLDP